MVASNCIFANLGATSRSFITYIIISVVSVALLDLLDLLVSCPFHSDSGAQEKFLLYFFFSVRNTMCGVWAWELVEMHVSHGHCVRLESPEPSLTSEHPPLPTSLCHPLTDLLPPHTIFRIKPYSPAVLVAVAMVASVNTIVEWSMGVMSSMINCACGSLR